MTGVEILATQEVATVFRFEWGIYAITILAFTVIGLFIGGISDIGNKCKGWRDGIITGLVIGIILGWFPACRATPIGYETQYKVIISEDVQANDFLETYEILDKQGNIYTVRERND